MVKDDLEMVERLRAIFLTEGKAFTDYWESQELLGAYDRTLARRIRWKWDSVLNVVKSQPGISAIQSVVDWGCGTGVASEALLDHFPEYSKKIFHLVDRSAMARQYTEEKLRQMKVTVSTELPHSPYLLLVSHVATELREKQWEELYDQMKRAQAVIWVEPGTPAVSAKLIEMREKLRNAFTVVAPCPHQDRCGLFSTKKDWCHFFADVPSHIHQSSEWKKLSQSLGIDLRSLPTSYLVLEREFKSEMSSEGRLIGRPRFYKGYASALVCRVEGVSEEKFLKRESDGPYEQLKKEAGFFVTISGKRR